jgi:hypothetical protein
MLGQHRVAIPLIKCGAFRLHKLPKGRQGIAKAPVDDPLIQTVGQMVYRPIGPILSRQRSILSLGPATTDLQVAPVGRTTAGALSLPVMRITTPPGVCGGKSTRRSGIIFVSPPSDQQE